MRHRLAICLLALLTTCSDQQPSQAVPGVQVAFDLDGTWQGPERFFSFPYPSDLRLTDLGRIDLAGFPNPHDGDLIRELVALAGQRRGFPVVPVAAFSFDGKLGQRQQSDLIPARSDAPVLLVDIDEGSPERGRLYPVMAQTLRSDVYLPDHVLAVAARPGIVLLPETKHAVVVLRSLQDEAGDPLGIPLALNQLIHGQVPGGKLGRSASELYAPLWPVLEQLGVDPEQVAAATVFTTGDVVEDTVELVNKAVEKYGPVSITALALDSDDGDHPEFCELIGSVRFPQFQRGDPPFDSEGLFELDGDGVPLKQRQEDARVVITLPKQPMPEGGYPLLVYFHGTNGWPDQLVDRQEKGQGPARVLAPLGIAGAAASLPLNPQRLPGAARYVYINLNNLPAFPYINQQAAIESLLFFDALDRLEIPPSVLGDCQGPSLPSDKAGFSFAAAAADKIAVMGQSLGASYINRIGAISKRVGAVITSGAGGFWSYYMFRTDRVPGDLIGPLVGIYGDVDFTHPVLHLLQTGWEPAEPLAFIPRMSRRPLDGHPVRQIYQPVGKNDSYFSAEIFDAMALAFGHQQAGEQIWSSMQQALALDGLDGIVPYPVKDNLSSDSKGEPYTGVVVQFDRGPGKDGHNVTFAMDGPKHQYRCFLDSFFKTGQAVVVAPAELDATCP